MRTWSVTNYLCSEEGAHKWKGVAVKNANKVNLNDLSMLITLLNPLEMLQLFWMNCRDQQS